MSQKTCISQTIKSDNVYVFISKGAFGMKPLKKDGQAKNERIQEHMLVFNKRLRPYLSKILQYSNFTFSAQ